METLIVAAIALVLVGVVVTGLLVARRRRGGVAIDDEMASELDTHGPDVETPPPPDREATDTGVIPPAPEDVEVAPEEAAEAAKAPPQEVAAGPEAPAPGELAPEEAAPERPATTRERFLDRLGRARNSLGVRVAAIFGGGITEEAWEELEESLIAADVGVEATTEIVEDLRARVRAEGAKTGEEALALLKDSLRSELAVGQRELRRRAEGPTVWLVTGVNGTGKTTSIGKLAARHTRDGEKVVLAAADTFRAAAADQLEAWGDQAGARVVRQGEGADPAAVAYDGFQAAASADLLVVDTAGRLQNKTALMSELSKVKRVLEREAGPCDEVLLVLDATTGQNGLSQARAFMEAVDVSGVVLTKLDGTAKGGIVIAIQRQLGLPVKLVGLGEHIDDLAEFDPEAFVEALFAEVAQEVDLDTGDGGAAGQAAAGDGQPAGGQSSADGQPAGDGEARSPRAEG